MNHIDTMKLALEALEESLGYVEEEAENAQRIYGQYPTRQARIQGLKDDVRKHMKAIAALREALAEQPAQQQEWIEAACALIKAADDAAADNDYMLDSDDCIKVIRGEWKGHLMNDRPAAPQPAQQQEPVAVPTTSYEHRKFVLVGRKWYERFAAFHDDCQIGERLTREEQTVRQQGYENGWNDAQRYLREPQASPPAQRKPWVGLTPEQRATIAEANNMLVDDDLFAAIEAKLKEKNT